MFTYGPLLIHESEVETHTFTYIFAKEQRTSPFLQTQHHYRTCSLVITTLSPATAHRKSSLESKNRCCGCWCIAWSATESMICLSTSSPSSLRRRRRHLSRTGPPKLKSQSRKQRFDALALLRGTVRADSLCVSLNQTARMIRAKIAKQMADNPEFAWGLEDSVVSEALGAEASTYDTTATSPSMRYGWCPPT